MFHDTCISFLGTLKETSDFKLQKLILSRFWEAGSLKWRYWQSCVLSEAWRGGSFFASSRFWKFADNFWQSSVCCCVLSISVFIIMCPFPCVSVSNRPFYYYKKLISGLVPTLVEYDHTLPWLYLQRTYFHIRSHSYFLWEEEKIRATVQLNR